MERTRLSVFVACYAILVSGFVLLDNLIHLGRYLVNYQKGFVLTIEGTALIVPLVPLVRSVLASAGVVGGVLLLKGLKKGLLVTLVWAALQIPMVTLSFQSLDNNVIGGGAALNTQLFYAGWNWWSCRGYRSVFLQTVSGFARGVGINVVGLTLVVLLLLILVRSSPRLGQTLHARLLRVYKIVSATVFLFLYPFTGCREKNLLKR